jgi:hypothetical protein
VILALGRSRDGAALQVVLCSLKAAGVLGGYHVAGAQGIILGLVAADWLYYIPVSLLMRWYGLLQWKVDLPVVCAAVIIGAMVLA